MMRCGATDVLNVVCDVRSVIRWMGSALIYVWLGHCDRVCRVWREGDKYLYIFADRNGERRRDMKWLTCLMIDAVSAM